MEEDKNNVLSMETKAFETLKEKSVLTVMILSTEDSSLGMMFSLISCQFPSPLTLGKGWINKYMFQADALASDSVLGIPTNYIVTTKCTC